MPGEKTSSKEFWWTFLLVFAAISCLLWGNYVPGQTQFSNDGPLGRLVSQCHELPGAFTGVWEDLNSIGYREQGAMPDITYGLKFLVGPILFSKFYVPVALMVLGMGAWFFFRQVGLAPVACMLGAVAAALNSDFFSTACWGVAADPITVGMCFFAMGALVKNGSWRGWVRAALAGLCVGIGLGEGSDVGAIFSFYVAAFAMYHAWVSEGQRLKNLAVGAGRVALVAIFAAFVAAQAIFALVSTQIVGVKGMQQDTKTREERWDWSTQWSLPKTETLSIVVPGLFGYRLDTLNGGNYWGSIGRSGDWERYLANGQQGTRPTNLIRQTGSGLYAGVTVVTLAIWAAVQALRRKDSVFSLIQRRWIWFWMGIAAVSLAFGFGRHAPFYRILYSLPYFSTIRNPVKYITQVNMALVILAAYGVDGLWRQYLQTAKTAYVRVSAANARFDKYWILGCGVVLLASLVGWAVYANYRTQMIEYLQTVNFANLRARATVDFSITQVGWFVLFFILTCGLMSLIFMGAFAGKKGYWGVGLLGLLLAVDLLRADAPWVIDWNYTEKYASNPVIDILKEKPYEARVALEPFKGRANHVLLDDLYHYEWAQQQFQYYNIQSLDIVQLPRTPTDLEAFQKATRFDGTLAKAPLMIRRWELTNTRYMMGSVEYLNPFNAEFDPEKRRFHIVTRFNIVRRTDTSSPRRLEQITAQLATNGDYAIFEFAGGLPRAKLYSSWEINTNNDAALKRIVNPSFEPANAVLVDNEIPPPAGPTNADAGTVDFTSYSPKDVVLSADAKTKCVLLLNDRYDANWNVQVDGKSAPLLRCNFIMRGVVLEPGPHKVEFIFKPPTQGLYVSLAGIATGLLLLGFIAVAKPKETPEVAAPASPRGNAPVPNQKPATAPVANSKSSKAQKEKQAARGKR